MSLTLSTFLSLLSTDMPCSCFKQTHWKPEKIRCSPPEMLLMKPFQLAPGKLWWPAKETYDGHLSKLTCRSGCKSCRSEADKSLMCCDDMPAQKGIRWQHITGISSLLLISIAHHLPGLLYWCAMSDAFVPTQDSPALKEAFPAGDNNHNVYGQCICSS